MLFLGEEASLDISVNIPGGLIRSGKLNFMDILNGISAETIKLKQIAIAKYAPQIQYSAPPLEYLQNKNDVTPWDPPFKDGVDTTLDGMFKRASRSVRNLSTDIPKRIMTSRQWSSEYDVVKVKTPGLPLTVFEIAPSQPGSVHAHTHGDKGEKGGLGHNKHGHQSNHNRPKNGNKSHNTTTTQ